MWELIIPLLGIFTGTIIGHYTKEEVISGKKYLLFLKHTFILIIAIAAIYFLGLEGNRFMLISPALLFLIVIVLNIFKPKFPYSLIEEVVNYTIFLTILWFYPSNFLASLVFLYGLPAGTLLTVKKLNDRDNKKV